MQQFKSKTMEIIVPELDRNLFNQLMKLTRNDQHIAVLTGHNFLLHHEKNMQTGDAHKNFLNFRCRISNRDHSAVVSKKFQNFVSICNHSMCV